MKDSKTNLQDTRCRRILFISHSAGRTGAPIMLLHFIRWLKSNSNPEIVILLREGGELELEFAKLGKTWLCDGRQISPLFCFSRKILRRIFGGYFDPKPEAQEKLLRNLENSKLDLVYSNTITNGEVLEWLLPLSVPVLTHVHEMSHWIIAAGQRNLELVKKHSLRYVAASNAVKLELHQKWGIPADRIDVVHEFIPTEARVGKSQVAKAIRKKCSIPSSAFIAVGSGVETWRKGKDLFVELALEINRQVPDNDFYFLWVGAWESEEHEKEFQSRIRAEGLQKQVLFVGQVENPLDYFGAADVFAMTSREDPYPLVCLEAALMDLPILCFEDAGGMPEFVEQDAGMVFPHLDVSAMAMGIADLAMFPDKKRKLGNAAYTKVKSRHDVAIGGKQLQDLIVQMLNSAPSF